MQPSFSGLLVTCANLPERDRRKYEARYKAHDKESKGEGLQYLGNMGAAEKNSSDFIKHCYKTTHVWFLRYYHMSFLNVLSEVNLMQTGLHRCACNFLHS